MPVHTCTDCGDPLAPDERDGLSVCHPCLDARAFTANMEAGAATRCVTHHHACDCREAEHARTVADLKAEKARLRHALSQIAAMTPVFDAKATATRKINKIASDAIYGTPENAD